MEVETTPRRRRPANARKIKRSFIAVVVGSALVLAGFGFVIDSNRSLAKDGHAAKDALCVLRADLAVRIAAGQSFLDEHPDGIPGISAKTIKASLTNQRSTYAALSGLNCPEPDAARAAMHVAAMHVAVTTPAITLFAAGAYGG